MIALPSGLGWGRLPPMIMGRMWTWSGWLAAVAIAGCCHVDRLAERALPVRSATLELAGEPRVGVLFTRKLNRQAKQFVGTFARTNRAVLDYQELIQELGGPELTDRLRTRLVQVLQRQLGWSPEDGDTRLVVELEEMAFSALDHLSPVTITWRLEAELFDERAGPALLWRECIEWDQALGALSIEQILRMEPEQRAELLDEVSVGLSEFLARRFSADSADSADSAEGRQ